MIFLLYFPLNRAIGILLSIFRQVSSCLSAEDAPFGVKIIWFPLAEHCALVAHNVGQPLYDYSSCQTGQSLTLLG